MRLKGLRAGADGGAVLLLRRRAADSLDDVLQDLPEGYVALAFGEAWVVVGPTGAFALAEAGSGNVRDVARRVAAAARELRNRLVQALSWAPFVDTLVVVAGPRGRRGARYPQSRCVASSCRDAPALTSAGDASVLPARILRGVLTSGPSCLSPTEVARIHAALSRGCESSPLEGSSSGADRGERSGFLTVEVVNPLRS